MLLNRLIFKEWLSYGGEYDDISMFISEHFVYQLENLDIPLNDKYVGNWLGPYAV